MRKYHKNYIRKNEERNIWGGLGGRNAIAKVRDELINNSSKLLWSKQMNRLSWTTANYL